MFIGEHIINDPDYIFSIDQSPKKIADRIMSMAEGSTAEIYGDEVAYLTKHLPSSYATGKQTGLVDLEIVCSAGIGNIKPIIDAMEPIAKNEEVYQISFYNGVTKTIHLYFHPKDIT